MSDVPSYVSLRHPGLHNNLASGDTLYTLPNAPVDVSYEVITKLGYPWYKWSKQALANAFPSQNTSKAGSAVFRMPADGDDYTLTSSYGNAFTFQSVSYDDLQVIDVLLRQKTNQHFNIMDTSAPTRSKGDIVIQLLKLRGEHAINYLSQDLYAHLSLESRTPKVCQVDKAAKDWHAIDAQSLKIERLTSEDFGDHLPSLGTLRILGEGVCTFSTTIGGASKTRSFEILP